MITIGIDLMGSDSDPLKLFYSICDFSKNLKEKINFKLFATF